MANNEGGNSEQIDFQSTNYNGNEPTGQFTIPAELRGLEPTQKPGGLLDRIAARFNAGAESIQSGIHGAVAKLTAPPTPPTNSRVVSPSDDLPWVADDDLGFDDNIELPQGQMVVPQAAPATKRPTGPGTMQRPTMRPTQVFPTGPQNYPGTMPRPTSRPPQRGENPKTGDKLGGASSGVTLPMDVNELGGARSGITGVLSTQYVGESRPAAPVQPEAKPEKPDFRKMILEDSGVQDELRILLDNETFNDVLQRAGANTLNDYDLYHILFHAQKGHHQPDVANSAFENLIKKLDLV